MKRAQPWGSAGRPTFEFSRVAKTHNKQGQRATPCCIGGTGSAIRYCSLLRLQLLVFSIQQGMIGLVEIEHATIVASGHIN